MAVTTSNAGTTGVSGGLTLATGVSSEGNSGAICVSSGSATEGRAGAISIAVGEGDSGTGGAVSITAGAAIGESGQSGGMDVPGQPRPRLTPTVVLLLRGGLTPPA